MTNPTNEELARRLAFLTGQVACLGIGLQAVLKHHPARDLVATLIHENYEQSIARALAKPFPEGFLDGMKATRDAYLLKD